MILKIKILTEINLILALMLFCSIGRTSDEEYLDFEPRVEYTYYISDWLSTEGDKLRIQVTCDPPEPPKYDGRCRIYYKEIKRSPYKDLKDLERKIAKGDRGYFLAYKLDNCGVENEEATIFKRTPLRDFHERLVSTICSSADKETLLKRLKPLVLESKGLCIVNNSGHELKFRGNKYGDVMIPIQRASGKCVIKFEVNLKNTERALGSLVCGNEVKSIEFNKNNIKDKCDMEI